MTTKAAELGRKVQALQQLRAFLMAPMNTMCGAEKLLGVAAYDRWRARQPAEVFQ